MFRLFSSACSLLLLRQKLTTVLSTLIERRTPLTLSAHVDVITLAHDGAQTFMNTDSRVASRFSAAESQVEDRERQRGVYCCNYATATTRQVLDAANLHCGYDGARWSSNIMLHAKRCLAAGDGLKETERTEPTQVWRRAEPTQAIERRPRSDPHIHRNGAAYSMISIGGSGLRHCFNIDASYFGAGSGSGAFRDFRRRFMPTRLRASLGESRNRSLAMRAR